MPKKQICPYCKQKFTYLSRHKCTLDPDNKKATSSSDEETEASEGDYEEEFEGEIPLKNKKSVPIKSKKTVVKSTKSAIKTPTQPITKSSKHTVQKITKNTPTFNKSLNISKEDVEKNKIRTQLVKRKSYSEIDKDIQTILKENKVMFKNELQKVLDIDEKALEKSIARLLSKQRLTVKADVKDGFRVEKITYIEDYEIKNTKEVINRNEIHWETLGDNPCFLCPDVRKCNAGQAETNPIRCQYLIDWINCCLKNQAYKSPFKGNVADIEKP